MKNYDEEKKCDWVRERRMEGISEIIMEALHQGHHCAVHTLSHARPRCTDTLVSALLGLEGSRCSAGGRGIRSLIVDLIVSL